jgi:hypothetical protein
LLAVMALPLTFSLGLARQDAEGEGIRFLGRCTFEHGGFSEVTAGLMNEAGQARVEELLRQHETAHGWSWRIDEPGLVREAESPRCPEEVLSAMAAVGELPRDWKSDFLCGYLAKALAHNGRTSEALALLERARGTYQDSDRTERWRSSFFAEEAARIAAFDGQWDRALELSKSWEPTSGCGNCAEAESSRIMLFRARCALSLRRCDDLRTLAIDALEPGLSSTSNAPSLFEMWIDCQLSRGGARDGPSALLAILGESPKEAEAACREGLRRWELAHAAREKQIEELEQVAVDHPELALRLLLSLGTRGIRDRLEAFEISGGSLRQPGLAWLLAATGHPEVGPSIERALEQCTEKPIVMTLERLFESWRIANTRWFALTTSAR